ncbi:NlpC/P60 family protein [Pedobacter sp. PWIIR3]
MSAVWILFGIICYTPVCSSAVLDGRIIAQEMSPAQQERREEFVKVAQSLVGIREGKKANTGKEVSGFLKYVGVQVPAPWCAAFVCWVFKMVGDAQPRTAWSPSLFPAPRLARDALPGNILGIYFPALKRIGHCGIIVETKGAWIYSVEGNTNLGGSRDGDGVYKRIRHKRSIAVIADWFKELPL